MRSITLNGDKALLREPGVSDIMPVVCSGTEYETGRASPLESGILEWQFGRVLIQSCVAFPKCLAIT